MIEEGNITADEGMDLLAALEEKPWGKKKAPP